MTIKRMDHVSVVVDDLAAAIAFFAALGMAREGEAPVEGPWVDRINGLESVQVDIVMMRTPDGRGRLELTKFRNPKLVEIEPAIAPPNTLGLRSVMFTVESVDDTVARLRANGAELVGEVARTRTSTGSATCEALRGSSSRWPRNSPEGKPWQLTKKALAQQSGNPGASPNRASWPRATRPWKPSYLFVAKLGGQNALYRYGTVSAVSIVKSARPRGARARRGSCSITRWYFSLSR